MGTLSKKSKRTKVSFFSLFLVLILMTPGCHPLRDLTAFKLGPSVKLNSDILVGPGECVLRIFQGTSVNNKFYLYWIFQSNSNQFLFQIESSADGKKFRPCYFKQGFSSPGTTPLMISIVDSTTQDEVVFYRLKAIPENFSIKKKTETEYKELFNASTIMIRKNIKTKDFMQY